MAEEITQSVFRVLVADPIDQAGIDLLKENGLQVDVKLRMTDDELCQLIGYYQALIVRSATKVTEQVIEKAFQLRVIARAGAGLPGPAPGAACR